MLPGFLIEIVVLLLVVFLVRYLVAMLAPDPALARVIDICMVVLVVLWLLSLLTGYGGNTYFPWRHR
jgi:hypothetical protein